jgi:hypothetical protein
MYVFGKLILLLVQYTGFQFPQVDQRFNMNKVPKIDTICVVKISVINFVSASAGSFYLLLA